MTTVLVADDQELVRLGMVMVLDAQPDLDVVAEVGDGETAVARALTLRPDVVLMDVRMPQLDGIEATRRIVTHAPDVRVLILTTFDLDEYAFGGLDAGASGFLLKDVPASELVAAIRTVASGEAIVSPRVTRRLLDIHRGRLAPSVVSAGDGAGSGEALTEREHDVRLAIAQGLSNTEIAAQLFLSESTVKTHVGRILAKLGLRDRVHVVIHAYQHGLV